MADDDDTYGDEFYDTGDLENEEDLGNAPDEQDHQKMNGQLEAALEELKNCQAELEAERQAHEETKKELLQTQQQPSNNDKNSDRLMESFINFALTHSLDSPTMETRDMTDEICLSILDQATKKLQKASRKPQPSSTTANMGESELHQRIANLEEELRLALGAAEDIRALKAKAVSLVERIRMEKEERLRCEAEQRSYLKKIEMLSDHVEKLMVHLKHEAAAKIKTVDQLRASEKRNEAAQVKLGITTRKAAAKDRLIAELREGSKILEDQLRLMDEKYLELRTKLDYAREVAAKKVRHAQKTASDLRVKFALAGNSKLLDQVPLPEIGASGDYTAEDLSRSMPNINTGPLSTASSPVRSSIRSIGKKKKKKLVTNSIAADAEQSTERVLDKIRRLRGGQAEWNEEKVRKLAMSH
mmetsp:Transcript_15831/g.23828  ORF Transcript_15831/g.23828 Transcript_15831/m.23828 type:complete len:415 (+) Transcript_15831:120-1364(+)|eukprot:CAMPEP_0185035576 /NCGR_PEP_ID=MMETSP1103-20130426/27215_1 /TAXON_ID=36769 /ORGANISM="Paraphysomonas bandaiensis, Strain Caron Lab Isolate" /LENGTH=414 /DNA_ID=CAMNT_0027572717 /DNA_START=78 /DNA_END=1322 /DNA_ORIENTATION=+